MVILLWCLGISAQQEEKLVIEGAIIVANNEDPSPTPGTIRWNGSHFQGWNGSNWVSLDFSALDELDGDSNNEVQDLTINGNLLSITLNGSPTQIDLSPYLDNTDTQLSDNEVVNIVTSNGFIQSEQDGDSTNEIQSFSVSETGDSLYLSDGNWVIIPGISIAQPEFF